MGGVQRKTSALLLPSFKYLVAFGIISYFAPLLPQSNLTQHSFWHFLTPEQLIIIPLAYQPLQYFAGTLWFVSALWMGMLLWLLLRNFIEPKIKSKVFTFFFVLSLIATYYSTINGPSLDRNLFIGCLDRAIYAFVFISFGYVLSFYKEALLYGKLRWLIFVVGLLAIYWKVRYWNHLPLADVRSMNFANFYKTRSLIVTFSGVAFIFATSIIIHKINWLADYFDYLGEKSFHIMALHSLGIYLFKWLTELCGLEFTVGYNAVIGEVGCLLSGLAFSLICIKIWNLAFAKKRNFLSQDIINPISYISKNIHKVIIIDGRK